MAEDIIGFEFDRRYYADLGNHRVLCDNEPLKPPLKKKEFEVLVFFLERPNQLVARGDVVPLSAINFTRYRLPIDDYVAKLNRRLGWEAGDVFVGTRGVGYTLKVDVRPVRGIDRQSASEIFKIAEINFNSHTVQHMRSSLQQSVEALERNPHGLPKARITAAYDYINLSQAAYAAELPKDVMLEARELALEALKHPSTEAAAHGVLGLIDLIYDYNWGKAAEEFATALSRDPDEAPTLLSYAHFLVASGKFNEAITAIEHAARLTPDDRIVHVSVGWIHLLSGDAKAAVRLGERAIELHPGFAPAHVMLGWAYEAMGEYDKAIEQYQASLKAEYAPAALASLGQLYAKLGRGDEAKGILSSLTTLYERGAIKYLPAYCRALIYAGLKETEKCLHELEQAYNQRCDWLIHLALDRRWDPVRDTARFKLLMTRVGIPYRG